MLLIKGAYGKDYKTKQEVLQAWKSGTDFRMINEKYAYCSIRDKETLLKEYFSITIIYNGYLDTVIITD